MSKFLNGSGVQAALTDIISNAEKELCIISPYLKIPTKTKNYLKSTDKKKYSNHNYLSNRVSFERR